MLPGFDAAFHFSLLPFWGNHCLVDFLAAAFDGSPAVDITIVLEEASREVAVPLSARWKRTVAKVQVVDDGLPGVARMLAQSPAEHAVIASTSSVFLVEPEDLRRRIAEIGDQVVKLSVAQTPVELYASRRQHLASLLAKAAERHPAPGPGLRSLLFNGLLHASIDLILDVPGEILFQNNLTEYYANNLWVVANGESARFNRAISRLPELAARSPESHVTERGSIRNSWLAAGVEVDGSVEDSILFPHVVVRRDALVSRTVVLNGNRIGSGTEVHGALILPFTSELPRPNPNIGDHCSIGARTSSMKNADFPAQIRDGLSVVGTNVDIPSGFKAEAATYVAPGVPATYLRKLKVLRRGTSALPDRAAAQEPRAASSGEPA